MLNTRVDPRFNRRRAFTLVEVLVVIGIIAILIGILIPVIRKAREGSYKAACAKQVNQMLVAMTAYSNASDQQLPAYQCAGTLGQFLWDVPTGARNKLMSYGLVRKIFYCPANLAQNQDIFWPYHSDPTWTVTGYFFLIPRPSWATALQNAVYTGGPADPHHDVNQAIFPGLHGQRRPAEYELITDAVIAINGSFNTANEAVGTSTSHIEGNKPLGGNVGFHDGHVVFRPFSEMVNRVHSPLTGPDHWW